MRKYVLSMLGILILMTACARNPIIINEPPDTAPVDLLMQEPHDTVTVPEPPPLPLWPPEPFAYASELNSRGVFIVDVHTGAEVFALNPDEHMLPASALKIMTFIVALELLEKRDIDLDERGLIEVPLLIWERFELEENPNTRGGSMSGLVPGQSTLTYRALFHALMLRSGNEAANVIAHNLGGGGADGIDTFVDLMNAKATELQLTNTQFANAHGLNEGVNHTTVRDMAMISLYGWRNYPLFREIAGAYEFDMPANSAYRNGYRVLNTNALMRESRDEGGNLTNNYYREFVGGIKTGSLNNVWIFDLATGEWVQNPGISNLVSFGEVDERAYIVVTLEAPWQRRTESASSSHNALVDHIALYDWLFDLALAE